MCWQAVLESVRINCIAIERSLPELFRLGCAIGSSAVEPHITTHSRAKASAGGIGSSNVTMVSGITTANCACGMRHERQ